MSDPHPAVQAYRDNKARYDADHFIRFVQNRAERNHQVDELRKTPEFVAFVGLATTTDPFAEIIAARDDLSNDDLQWMIDNMPSGWDRALLMEAQEKKYGK